MSLRRSGSRLSRVLLAVYTAGHFVELIRVVRLLRETGRYAPTVWFAWPYEEMDRDIGICKAENIPYLEDRTGSAVVVDGEVPRDQKAVPFYKLPAHYLREALCSLPFPFTAARAIYRQGQHVWLARKIVKRCRPACVILAADDYETAVLIRAAHQSGVPTVIVPFTIANAIEPAEARFHDPNYSLERWDNRLVGRLFPRWVREHRGRTLLRAVAPIVVAKELWGLAPPQPWQMNSGAADVIAVESAFMESFYLREGLSQHKLVRTGALSDDILAENADDASARRVALCAELELPSDQPLILCALPPDHFCLSGAQTDFADYAEMVQFWVRSLAALPGCSVVIRLHPRTSYDALRYIEQWGVRITQRDTATLVPLCDLYVASISATIRWAIACGKPVVNYDVYRLRFSDYADAAGVLSVEERAEFVATLQQLAGDREFFGKIRAQQEVDANRWGTLDGHAGARLFQCLESVMSRSSQGTA